MLKSTNRFMRFTYDIHSHSTHSDGDYPPAMVAEKAQAAGLKAQVLTDHNTTYGYSEFRAACKKFGLDTFPGIEISSRHTDVELHVLGFAEQFDEARLRSGLRDTIRGYNERIQGMLERLHQMGKTQVIFMDLRGQKAGLDPVTKYDLIRAIAREQAPSPGQRQEFLRLINRGGPAFMPYTDDFLSPVEACRLIDDAGGISVLAHPGQYARRHPQGQEAGRAEFRRLLPELIASGVRGLECRSFEHTDDDVHFYTALAKEFDLLILGSSDWHGELHHPGRVLGESGVTEREYHALKAVLPERF